jgi:peptidoglycan/xylan/chitin deacetylase (PgdA/CDA1 family)
MSDSAVRDEMRRAVGVYEQVVGCRPKGFGAPGWQCNPFSLRMVDELGFTYASDTRGRHPFFPTVGDVRLRTLQLPTTLPTLDEVLGVDGGDGKGFLALISRALERDPWPVLTLHAELEGGRFVPLADELLASCEARRVDCLPLAEVASAVRAGGDDRIPGATVISRPIRGRHGSVAMPAGWEPAR